MLSVCNPPVGSGINPMRIAERLSGFKPHLTYSTVDNPGVDLEFSDDEDEDPSPPPQSPQHHHPDAPPSARVLRAHVLLLLLG